MIRLLGLFFLAANLVAAEPTLTVKLAPTEVPKEIADGLRKSLRGDAHLVRDAKGAFATLWLCQELAVSATPEQRKVGLTYRHLAPGTLLGVLHLQRGWRDFHEQEVEAGIYALRYAVQPNTKDHEGTAPHRDFAILVPIAKETKPDPLPLKTLIAHSGTITGGTHPVVLQLYPHPKPDATPSITRVGKAGHTLRTTHTLRSDKTTTPMGIAFNLLGTGTEE